MATCSAPVLAENTDLVEMALLHMYLALLRKGLALLHKGLALLRKGLALLRNGLVLLRKDTLDPQAVGIRGFGMD